VWGKGKGDRHFQRIDIYINAMRVGRGALWDGPKNRIANIGEMATFRNSDVKCPSDHQLEVVIEVNEHEEKSGDETEESDNLEGLSPWEKIKYAKNDGCEELGLLEVEEIIKYGMSVLSSSATTNQVHRAPSPADTQGGSNTLLA